MLGGKNKQPLGYTIIEVLIVLAVTGLMFVIAANFINGKQERTAFTTGVNEMASRIQDVIEQVRDGQYSDVGLECTLTGTTVNVRLTGSPSDKQGTQSDCVFLGKVLYFPPPTPTESYQILSIAGRRLNASTGNVATSLSNAGASPISDLTTDQNTPQKLDVTKVSPAHSFGFIQSQGSVNAADNKLQSGAQSVQMYSFDNPLTSPVTTPSLISAAYICLTDGTQNARINLGTDAGQLSAQVKRYGEATAPGCT